MDQQLVRGLALVIGIGASVSLLSALYTTPTLGQVSDLCEGSLHYQADPAEVIRFRQQCTIQRLLAERADEANQKTAAEVELAVEKAHNKALAETPKLSPELSTAIEAACAWHGTLNEPTAKMCKLWRSR